LNYNVKNVTNIASPYIDIRSKLARKKNTPYLPAIKIYAQMMCGKQKEMQISISALNLWCACKNSGHRME
jgi:hypothetical protein